MNRETLYTKDFRRLKAEVVLDLMYPQSQEFRVRSAGNFYRNYSPDLMDVDDSLNEVSLSRDGIIKVLPDAFITPDGIEESREEQKLRLSILADAFLPIDSFFLTQYIKAQREIDSIVGRKTEIILKTYFDYDLDAEQNPYVRKLAFMLPFARILRGKIGIMRMMFSAIFGEKVTSQTYPHSTDDNTKGYIPKTVFTLWIPGLTSEGYYQKMEEIEPAFRFAKDWFLPFDHVFDIAICDYSTQQCDILDYNTKLTE